MEIEDGGFFLFNESNGNRSVAPVVFSGTTLWLSESFCEAGRPFH